MTAWDDPDTPFVPRRRTGRGSVLIGWLLAAAVVAGIVVLLVVLGVGSAGAAGSCGGG